MADNQSLTGEEPEARMSIEVPERGDAIQQSPASSAHAPPPLDEGLSMQEIQARIAEQQARRDRALALLNLRQIEAEVS
jgi:hypothetical protein